MSFRVLGVRFEVSYIFACAFSLFIANDRSGVLIPLIISILLHESAHALCLYIFKCKIKSVKLLIGTLRIEYEENIKDFEKIISLIAGPFMNIILAILTYYLKNELYFAINIVLALYNLLPIKGLDGGAIFELFLLNFLPYKTVSKIILFTSLVVLSILIFLFILLLEDISFNYSTILFVLYLILPFILKKLG